MIIYNNELNKLSADIWEWGKQGKPLSEAPPEIKEKTERAKELYWKLKNDEYRMMGINV